MMVVDARRLFLSRFRHSALTALGHWLLAAYFAVAQPGLCLCELAGQLLFSHLHGRHGLCLAKVDTHHDNHPYTQLLVLLRANASTTVLPIVEDAETLLRRLQSGLLVRLDAVCPSAHGRQPSPEPPPPRP
ncbi:MAG: hypothetical protein RMK99_06180 [Anaerolineales bacterium]|nr:hypothetical protein [Anaerolineales bacterium]